MSRTKNINNLSEGDINDFYNYLCDFELNHRKDYGRFDYDDSQFVKFCKDNNITKKGCNSSKRSNKNNDFFWFTARKRKEDKEDKEGVNDFGYHLLKHIRNSIAHGLVRKRGKYFLFEDYSLNKTSQTMGGKMRKDLFWSFVGELIKTKR